VVEVAEIMVTFDVYEPSDFWLAFINLGLCHHVAEFGDDPSDL